MRPGCHARETAMATSEIIEDIKEELKCTLCLDHFREPKILHCLHTFCKPCLVQTAEQNAIVCPLCRQTTELSSKGIECLPSNFLYTRMIDIVRVQGDSTWAGDEPKCGNCDETDQPKSYCFGCVCFLCEECLRVHDRIKAIREGHRVTELAVLDSSELQNLMRRSSRCKQHKDNVLEFYCSHCETSVCKECSRIAHKNHSCMPLKELSADCKVEIETVVIQAERRLVALERKKCGFEDKATQLNQEVRRTEEDVHRTAERLISSIRHHELAMIEELNTYHGVLETAISTERSSLDSHMEELKKNLKFSKEVLHDASQAEIVDLKPSIVMALRAVDEAMPKMAWRWMDAQYIANKDVFNLICEPGRVVTSYTDPERTEAYGLRDTAVVGEKTRFTITTRNVDGQECHSDINRVTVKAISTALEIPVDKVEIQNQGSASYSVAFFPEYPGEHTVRITINDVEVPQSPLLIHVSLHAASAFGFLANGPAQFMGPTRIAVSNQGEQIAVSDSGNKRIQLFDKTGQFLRQIDEYFVGGKSVRFGLPAGVAFDKFDNLAVVDQRNSKLLVINPMTGNLVTDLKSDGEGSGQLVRPWGVSIDNTGRFIVCDIEDDSVQVFNHNGEFLFMFGDNGKGGNLKGPDSALYHNGRFIVSDSDNHCLKVFDEVGNFLFKFGEEGCEDGQLVNPTGLCVYKENTILVCDYRNDRIQLFTMEGQHVYSFGSFGTALGQFSWPDDVAVLPDGSVLITDSENNRIQLLK